MQQDAYHVRRGFVQKTANKMVNNDGKRLLFAYPFMDVVALINGSPIHQPIFFCSSYSPQSSPPQCDHIILTLYLVFLCFFGIALFLLVFECHCQPPYDFVLSPSASINDPIYSKLFTLFFFINYFKLTFVGSRHPFTFYICVFFIFV